MNISSKLYSRIFMNYDLFTQRRCTVYSIAPTRNTKEDACVVLGRNDFFHVVVVVRVSLVHWGCRDILQPILEKRYR